MRYRRQRQKQKRVEARNSQLEVNPNKLTKESPRDLQEEELTFNKEIEDLALRTEDIILEDIDNAPLGTSQLEINDTKEYWKRQIDYAVANYKEPKGIALEDSVQAPNESTYENAGEYKAKVASVVLPGNTKEERIKFVEGTIYKNKHISKIEEYFIRGNAWVIISFDCHKRLEILKERIREKEIEQYKVIFEEDESQKNYKSTSDNKQSKNMEKENSKKVKEEKPIQDLYEKKGIEDSKSCEYKQVLGKRDTGKATNRISVQDLLVQAKRLQVFESVRYLGRVKFIEIIREAYGKTRAEIEFEPESLNTEEIERIWCIPFLGDYLVRITPGISNFEKLRVRSKYSRRLIDLPENTNEVLLWRQIR